jgi:hypothetical protein
VSSASRRLGTYSLYVFHGIAQTRRHPAIQGEFAYAHASGADAGTSLSTCAADLLVMSAAHSL